LCCVGVLSSQGLDDALVSRNPQILVDYRVHCSR
jgi:hypothetical protein